MKLFKKALSLSMIISILTTPSLPVSASDKMQSNNTFNNKQIFNEVIERDLQAIDLEGMKDGEIITQNYSVEIHGETVTYQLEIECVHVPAIQSYVSLPEWQKIREYNITAKFNAASRNAFSGALTTILLQNSVAAGVVYSVVAAFSDYYMTGVSLYECDINRAVYGKTNHLNKYKHIDRYYLNGRYITQKEYEIY